MGDNILQQVKEAIERSTRYDNLGKGGEKKNKDEM
jgi:hypothetical protein